MDSTAFAFSLFCVALVVSHSRAEEHKTVVKRQSSVPTCGGAASGSVPAGAAAGTSVATVSSSDPAGLTVWYTITDPTFSSAFNVNPYTGAVSVGSNFANLASTRSTASFTVQTTNSAGGTCSTPVSVAISGGAAGAAVAASPTRYVDTCGCGPGYYCFQGVCYSIFGSSSNAFTITTCATGTYVGRVSVKNTYTFGVTAGTGNYYITNVGDLYVSNTIATSGTYTIPVISYLYGGNTIVTTATVTASCSGTAGTFCVGAFCFNTGSQAAVVTSCGSGGISILGLCFNDTTTTANSVGATFNATSYQFTTTACAAGTAVGTVGASSATGYSINYGAPTFTVSSSGAITLRTALTTGTYSISVVANSASGFQTSVPVTVNVVCPTG